MRIKTTLLVGAMAAAFAAGHAQADTIDAAAAAAAARFGALDSVLSASLSPNGDKLVIVAPRPDGHENAVVVDLVTGNAVPVLSSTGDEKVTNCQFVLQERIVCQIYLMDGSGRSIDAATRLATISADGKSMKMLTAQMSHNAYGNAASGGNIIDYNVAGKPTAVLMSRYLVTEQRTGTIAGRSESGLMVEQVDLISLKRSQVERPRENAVWYATDGQGSVRLMGTMQPNPAGYTKSETNYFYRPAGGGDWQPLSTVVDDNGLSRGFDPFAVDSQRNVAYGFDISDGHTALFERALDGSGTTRKVLGRKDVDVDGLIQIGRSDRVVGASYVGEYRVAEYFDEDLRKLAQGLGKALPGNPTIFFADASSDEGKLLVLASSDTDPGMYYLYDKGTRQLASLLPVRNELEGVKLGQMRPVSYPAADGTMIPGYLTLPPGSDGKNLPAIVMPHGGPAARDEWGFDWLVQYFATRGFAVLQPNYRGSTGYGAEWFQNNGFQSWETAIGDVNDAGRWLQVQGIAAPGKLAIFGWSYGGYAALQSAVLDPNRYKAIVAVAPVTDLDAWREELRMSSAYRIRDTFVGTGPHVAAGSPARHADRFVAPVLLFHGDRDLNVGVGESRLMADRLKSAGKSVEYVEFPRLAHSLADSAARTRLLAMSERHIRKALGIELP